MPISVSATNLTPQVLYAPRGTETNPPFRPALDDGQLTVLTIDLKTLLARAGITSLAAGSYVIANLPQCKILPSSYITTSGKASLTLSLALNDYVDDTGATIVNSTATQIINAASLASAGTQLFSALTNGVTPTAGGGFSLRPADTAQLVMTTAGATIATADNVEIVLHLVTRR